MTPKEIWSSRDDWDFYYQHKMPLEEVKESSMSSKEEESMEIEEPEANVVLVLSNILSSI